MSLAPDLKHQSRANCSMAEYIFLQIDNSISYGVGRLNLENSVHVKSKIEMKRFGNLYEKIYNWDNLILADQRSSSGKKKHTYGVRIYRQHRYENLKKLQEMLINEKFKTSEYHIMTIKADHGKIREISKLPYFPDRILHHAIMNVIEPILVNNLINDTYACIKGKGLHFGVNRVKQAMKNKEQTKWCLKTDIHKFYPSIDQESTISDLKRKFKDQRLINLISEIIHSMPKGLPIGLYTSQLIANFCLSRLDHYIKEELKVKYYFRYCDDMVFLGQTKDEMKKIFKEVNNKIENELHLKIKPNVAIFPIGEERKNEEKTKRKRKRSQRKKHRLPGISVHTRKDIAA